MQNIQIPAALRSAAFAASASAPSTDAMSADTTSRMLKANNVRVQLAQLPAALATKTNEILAPVSQAEMQEAGRLAADTGTQVTLRARWNTGGHDAELPKTAELAPLLELSTKNGQLDWSYSHPELESLLASGKVFLVAEHMALDVNSPSPVQQTATLVGVKASPNDPGYVPGKKRDISVPFQVKEFLANADGVIRGKVLANRPFNDHSVVFLQQHGATLKGIKGTIKRIDGKDGNYTPGMIGTHLPEDHLVHRFATMYGAHASVPDADGLVKLSLEDGDAATQRAEAYLDSNFIPFNPATTTLRFVAGGMRDAATGGMYYTGFNNYAYASNMMPGQFQHSGELIVQARLVTIADK